MTNPNPLIITALVSEEENLSCLLSSDLLDCHSSITIMCHFIACHPLYVLKGTPCNFWPKELTHMSYFKWFLRQIDSTWHYQCSDWGCPLETWTLARSYDLENAWRAYIFTIVTWPQARKSQGKENEKLTLWENRTRVSLSQAFT